LGGGGGGGSSGNNGLQDGQYRNTRDGAYATEYSNQAGLASVNALSLNDYGYTGAGIKVGVVDSGIDASHAEFNGKTIFGKDFASSASGYGNDENLFLLVRYQVNNVVAMLNLLKNHLMKN